MEGSEFTALTSYVHSYLAAHPNVLNPLVNSNVHKIWRWARLQLPVGQIARSVWKEMNTKRESRSSRNVKVCDVMQTWIQTFSPMLDWETRRNKHWRSAILLSITTRHSCEDSGPCINIFRSKPGAFQSFPWHSLFQLLFGNISSSSDWHLKNQNCCSNGGTSKTWRI